MSKAPLLFDLNALKAHRQRAQNALADFLILEAIDSLQERLKEVNRSFTDLTLIGDWTGLWQQNMPSARAIPDTDILALETGSADATLSCMTLHWANDPVGQLVQIRHGLRPDGLFLGALLGGQTLHELRSCLAEAEAELEGGLSPRISPMGDLRDMGALLQRAGFAMPVADSARLTVSYRSALHLMQDLRAMGETNALIGRRKSFSRRATLLRAATLYQQHFGQEDGRVPATFEMVFLTGWAPSPDQQQPLRPGSAKARLADALGTFEIPTGEKPR